jgi:hypothetical protein
LPVIHQHFPGLCFRPGHRVAGSTRYPMMLKN